MRSNDPHQLLDETNDLVPLLLGALKLIDDLAAALAASAELLKIDPAPVDETIITAALGALSLRRTLRRWIDLACAEPAHAPAMRAQATLLPLLR